MPSGDRPAGSGDHRRKGALISSSAGQRERIESSAADAGGRKEAVGGGPGADDSAIEESGLDVMISAGVVVLVGAVAVGVQRLLRVVLGRKGMMREDRVQRAIVARAVPAVARQKARRAGRRLKFVISENFKTPASHTPRAGEPWKSLLSRLPEESPLIGRIIAQGEEFSGRTQTQEPGLRVVEDHEPFLRNPAAPGCVCGASATGAAVAVSASLSDLALATDTLGNLRVPAACCGVIGMRCTSGCLDTRGVLPVSKNLDSMGFMVKTPSLLGRAAELLQLPGKKDWRGDVIKIYLARDLFSNWRGEEGFAMYAAIAKACLKWAGPEMVEEFDLSQFLDAHAGDWKEFAGQDGDVYEGLRQAGLCIGKHEFAECHRSKDDHSERNETSENETSPSASQVGDDDLYEKALKIRSSVQEAFKAGIRENKLVVTPLLLRPPIPRSSSLDELHQFESECQRLCALASLVGCPQVNFPVHSASGQLFSVAIMSLNKSDRPLLAITEKLIDQITKMMDKNEPERALAAKEPASKKQANGKHTDDREAEAEKFRHLGNDCYKEGRFEEAIAAYTQAIRRHPKAVYYSNRAQAYSNLMDFEAAEADCTAALALDSVNAKALLRRGFAREGMNKMAEAKKDFLQVLAIEPNNVQAREELRVVNRKLSAAH